MTLTRLVFLGTLFAEALLGAAFLLTLIAPARRVWPPPARHSWQFTYVWGLTVPAMLGGFAVGLLDWNSFVFDHWLRYPLGGLLATTGLAFAVWGMAGLSMHTTLGLEGKFVESGAYRYSRNPQYVGDIAMFLGYALVCNSNLTWIVSGIGSALFAIMPFLEEPWLRERFGAEYDAYLRRVPRFLGAHRD